MSMVLAETTLKTMLSNCVAFQTYVGAADAAAALARIHRGAMPSPSDDDTEDGTRSQKATLDLYPNATIWTIDYSQRGDSTTGGMSTYLPSGTLAVALAHLDTLGLTSQELYAVEMSLWDAIIPQLWDQTGAGGLAITNISTNEIKHRSIQSRSELSVEDPDLAYRSRDTSEIVVLIEWGSEGGIE